MKNDEYVSKTKSVCFMGDVKDMDKVAKLVERLKKKDKGYSLSYLIRDWIKQGLKDSK